MQFKHVNLLATCALLFISMTGTAVCERGPLQVQNRFPLFLGLLTPRPTSALLPAKGNAEVSFGVDYSSIQFNQKSDRAFVLVDLESTVIEFAFKFSVNRRLALQVELPIVSLNSGFMDHFLAGYHDALGVPNYGREDRPSNAFAYDAAINGHPWIKGDSGSLQLADTTFSIQRSISLPGAGKPWAASLLWRLKLPTGDSHAGVGSGNYDVGLFMPTQWTKGRWDLYLMPGFILHGDPEVPGAQAAARRSWSLFTGASYQYHPKWRWLVQVDYFSSPIEQTGIGMLDAGGLELAAGFRYAFHSRWRLEAAFIEDVFTLTAPDFTVHLGLIWLYRKECNDRQ
ncbi:MAG: DUF3187 family protein [Desulfatitalea sp.]|nr:DUF3187 family protein [Desulfatitalea sp.]NNK00073.1 DUF3187 family protein [Desulfatitalea sp.]